MFAMKKRGVTIFIFPNFDIKIRIYEKYGRI